MGGCLEKALLEDLFVCLGEREQASRLESRGGCRRRGRGNLKPMSRLVEWRSPQERGADGWSFWTFHAAVFPAFWSRACPIRPPIAHTGAAHRLSATLPQIIHCFHGQLDRVHGNGQLMPSPRIPRPRRCNMGSERSFRPLCRAGQGTSRISSSSWKPPHPAQAALTVTVTRGRTWRLWPERRSQLLRGWRSLG